MTHCLMMLWSFPLRRLTNWEAPCGCSERATFCGTIRNFCWDHFLD